MVNGERTGRSHAGERIIHEDLLWQFFEEKVIPAIQLYQMGEKGGNGIEEQEFTQEDFEETLLEALEHQPVNKVSGFILLPW